jgi:hypothetical protein
MPLKKVVVFSTDAMRGSLIQKALVRWAVAPAGVATGSAQQHVNANHEEMLTPLLFKDIIHTGEILARELPTVVVLDTKGYFSGELEKFRNGCSQVSAQTLPLKVLAIGNAADKNLLVLNDVATEWCMDTPLDPMLIASKVKALLDAGIKPGGHNGVQPETDVLLEDLKGFLNIKI